MGFTDNYTKKAASSTPIKSQEIATVRRKTSTNDQNSASYETFELNIGDEDDNDKAIRRSLLIPDQEILDSTEEIYFQENVDTGIYELNVRSH